MRRFFLLCAVVGLLAVTPAAAQTSGPDAIGFLADLLTDDHSILLIPEAGQDPVFTSLENLGSFGQFQNTNDYAYNNEADLALITGDESTRNLKRPSESGEGRARVVFTNLTNYAIEDVDTAGALQLGGVHKVGPGNLSVGFGYRSFESEFSCSSTGTGSCGNGPGTSDFGKFEMPAFDLAVAYGWKLSEKSALGFSFRYGNGEEKLTDWEDPTAGTPDINNQEYTWDSVRFGGAFRMDMSERMSWNVRAFVSSTSPEFTFTDTDDNVNIKMSNSTLGLAGRVNWYTDNADYEAFIGYAGSKADIDDALAQVLDGTGNVLFAEEWADDFNRTDFFVGVRGLYRLGKADFAPALVLENSNIDGTVRTMEQGQPALFGASFDDTVNTFSVPFSARYHFTQKFAAGVGARWSWAMIEDKFTDEFFGTGSEGSVTEEFETTQTSSEYRLFMRYGDEHFSGQLLFANELSNPFFTATGAPQPGSVIPSSGDRNFERNDLSIDTVAIMVNVSW